MIDFSRLEQYRENNRIEAKRALGGLPQSIWETYSAFANTLGGILLLGVEERPDKSLHTVDLPDPERLVREFWSMVNDPKKASVNILTENDVRIENVSGDHIIVITVPRASRFQKPVYVDGDPVRGSYRRSGEGDLRCTAEELSAMHRDAALVTQDMALLEKTALSALREESVRGYREKLRSARPGHAWETLPDEAFLQKLGAAGAGRDGTVHPTAAGLLMFGREAEILCVYPRFSLRFRMGKAPAEALAENIFDYTFRVLDRLDSHPALADEAVRDAVREALGNCLVNADYYGRGGVEVVCREDGLSFTNPGDFRIGVEAARTGGRSDPRNGLLMKMFNLLDVGKSAGGGIPGIFNTWMRQGFAEPAIVPNVGAGSVTFSLPLGPGRARGGGKRAAGKSSLRKAARRDLLISHLTDHASATEAELAVLLGLRPSGVRALLAELTAEGIVAAADRDGERIYKLKS